MAQHDLTFKFFEFFDRHLIFPLLEFLGEKHLFDEGDISKAKLDLLQTTNMVDFMMEIYTNELQKPVPQELEKKRNEVVETLNTLQEQTVPIVQILESDDVSKQIQNLRDRDGRALLDYLVKSHEFHVDMLDQLYTYAKFAYECGNYTAASEYLDFYRLLVPPNHANYLNCLWGKLSSEILLQNWENAKTDLTTLKAYIDNYNFETEVETLQQRAWLMHWALFVFFNHPKGRDDIIDICLGSNQNSLAYLNAIQIRCPHILRYLCVAVVTNKKRRACMKDLVKVIQLESVNYKDPVTELLECLYVNYDFDGAQQKLRECSQVLTNDFFLTACLDEFIDNARLLIFEMFCRIHQCISIEMLAEKLNMEKEQAERWIVNLIRNAQLDAKIDSTLGHVVMGTKATCIHEQVMENTKRLSFRAQSMAFTLEKMIIDNKASVWSQAHVQKC